VHNRITPYGLITSLARSKTEIRYIFYNTRNNIVIRSLLDFFEEETINHFNSSGDFLALRQEGKPITIEYLLKWIKLPV
jgi:hypothetical protein